MTREGVELLDCGESCSGKRTSELLLVSWLEPSKNQRAMEPGGAFHRVQHPGHRLKVGRN